MFLNIWKTPLMFFMGEDLILFRLDTLNLKYIFILIRKHINTQKQVLLELF